MGVIRNLVLGRGLRLAAALLCATGCWLLVAAASQAVPIDVYFDRNAGFGIEAGGAADAQAAGAALYTVPVFFTEGIGISTPDPFPGFNAPSPSRATPSTGSTTWILEALDGDHEDLWIVFRRHSPNDANFAFYDPGGDALGTVGLAIDPASGWALMSPEGFPDTIYLAYFIGSLAQGETAGVPIDYRVAQVLFQSESGAYMFPRLSIGFTSFAVPEPTATMLLGLGLMGLAGAWRRR